jgi:hypothetical protein
MYSLSVGPVYSSLPFSNTPLKRLHVAILLTVQLICFPFVIGVFLLRIIAGNTVKKSKVIPLHAMEAHGVRGGIAPTHS